MPTDPNANPAAHNPELAAQRYLRVAEVHDDTIVLKAGGLRAVLEVSSVNFDLKSPAEQEAIIGAYAAFLNTLEHPVQVLVRSRTVDIDDYLAKVQARADKQQNPLLKTQTSDYADFVRRLVDYAGMMEKRFFIIVPVDPLLSQSTKKGMFEQFWANINPADNAEKYLTRRKGYLQLAKQLAERVSSVQGSLQGQLGLASRQLGTAELLDLIYAGSNPTTSRTVRLADALAQHAAEAATLRGSGTEAAGR